MESAEVDLLDGLVQLSFRVHELLAAVGTRHNMSIVQVRLLGILRDREPTMTELARHLTLDRSSVTGLIDRAEVRGLVTRVASASDGRGVHVRLTARGRRLCSAAEVEVADAISTLCSALSAAEALQLRRLATKMLASERPVASASAS
jgi:MarR family transcriptional regulator, lower aerobic nicotinate degradation pathway regulator